MKIKRANLLTYLTMFIIDDKYILVHCDDDAYFIKEIKIPPRKDQYIIVDYDYTPKTRIIEDALSDVENTLKNGTRLILKDTY